jgi:nucleoside-diphosphate-sugar epimerase
MVVGNLHEQNILDEVFRVACEGEYCRKAVIHLAGISSVDKTRQNPVAVAADNALLAVKILNAARENGIGRFMFSSSGMVYQRGSDIPCKETAPVAYTTYYGAVKLAAEALVQGFINDYGMSGEIIRLSNVYSSDSRGNTVIGRMLGQVRAGQPLSVQTLQPVRDFIYVADVCEAIYRLLASTDEIGCNITNVSSGIGNSIGSVVGMFAKLVGVEPPKLVEDTFDDILILDNKKLMSRTGWSPQCTLYDGLEACLNASIQIGDILDETGSYCRSSSG